MASGTVSSTSTYTPGKGVSFAKDIASRVVDAAVAAKNERKLQEKIIAEGGTIPEKERKGLFVKALKQEFITNPINDIKKNWNKKLAKVGRVAGLFGKTGEGIESKLTKGGKGFFNIQKGFDRSNYKSKSKADGAGGGGGGAGVSGSVLTGLGELVLDIQQIAASIGSIQGLISTQLNFSVKMVDALSEIKSVLTDQIDAQQKQIENEEMAKREDSIEASGSSSGTAESVSTYREGDAISQLFSMIEFVKNIPKIISNIMSVVRKVISGVTDVIGNVIKSVKGFFTGGANKITQEATKKVTSEVAEEGVETGIKLFGKKFGLQFLSKFLRPVFKRIPVFGPIIDFVVSLAFGESVGRAAARAVGAALGAGLGTLIPIPGVGTIAGGILGDWVGGSLYDLIAGAFSGGGEKKMAAGGVMIGEAGPEAVVDLHSADAQNILNSNSAPNETISEVRDNYYSALAGSTLAVTKDFVEGLGPVGEAVAPKIKDDIDKLGKTFDIPATATNVSVGGQSLRANKQAQKKGQSYLEELVEGTLKKLDVKKTEKGKQSGGGDSFMSSDSDSSSEDTGASTESASPSENTRGQSGSAQKITASSFADTQLKNTKPVFSDKGENAINVGNKNLQKVGGGNPGKYYYDAFGNIYAIDKDEKRVLTRQEINAGVPGALFGNFKFFRNLNNGVVNLATRGDAKEVGWYDYETNSVKEQSKAAGVSYAEWVPVAQSKQFKNQFNQETPYGKSTIKAESGVSIVNPIPSQNIANNKGGYASDTGLDILTPIGSRVVSPVSGVLEYAERGHTIQSGQDANPDMPGMQDQHSVRIKLDKPFRYAGKQINYFYATHLYEIASNLKNKSNIRINAGDFLGKSGVANNVPHVHVGFLEDRLQTKFLNFKEVKSLLTGSKVADNGGDVDHGDSGGDNVASETNPLEAIQKAISGMLVGAAIMNTPGINTIEDYQNKKSEFEKAFAFEPPESAPAESPEEKKERDQLIQRSRTSNVAPVAITKRERTQLNNAGVGVNPATGAIPGSATDAAMRDLQNGSGVGASLSLTRSTTPAGTAGSLRPVMGGI